MSEETREYIAARDALAKRLFDQTGNNYWALYSLWLTNSWFKPDISQALANTRAQFLSVSQAAAAAFDTHLLDDFRDAFDSTGIGFAKVIQGMSNASAEVTAQITNQRNQLQGEIDQINQLGTASDQGFGAFGANADAAATRMQNLVHGVAWSRGTIGSTHFVERRIHCRYL